MSYLIKNATIVNEGTTQVASLLIEGSEIARIIPHGSPLPDATHVIEAEGLYCLPGIIDDQVHFRDPGLTHKGDLTTESESALLGGVTSFMEMPNTIPQTTTIEAWEEKMSMASEKSRANYSFYFGATNDNVALLELLDLRYTPGVKVFMGSSTGNMLVDSEESLRAIFQNSPKIIAVHSESEPIIQENIKRYKEQYGEDPDLKWHPYIRSREACYESSVRAVALAKETGARLHILHISTKEELELLSPDSETPLAEKQITGEVCVHHLWFDDEDYDRLGTRIKWNPAIKQKADKEALRKGVNNRVLDIVATDHAPHLPTEKRGGALKAASGGPLIQHSLLMMLEMARDGIFELATVVDLMCHRPAVLFGVERRGFIREGYKADIVLVKPDTPWVVAKDNIQSKCGWSPLEGETLHHQVWYTFLNGAPVVSEGVLDPLLAKEKKEALTFSR
ncbi:MAG: dihydroorotase [Porphyromonas sp.]|nr:dihydroorotase [Porphyromonas sp.]